MPEELLEEKISIFDSIGKSIDSLIESIKSIPSLIKNTVYYSYYTAKLSLGFAIGTVIGNIVPALIMSFGSIAGKYLNNLKNEVNTTYKQIANEGAIGAILGGVLSNIFKGIHYVGNAIRAAYGKAFGLSTKVILSLARMPVVAIGREYLYRASISDYIPKKWKDMKKQITESMKWIGPIGIANVCFAPPYLNVPIAVAASTGLGYILAKPEKKDPNKAHTPSEYQPLKGYQMPIAA